MKQKTIFFSYLKYGIYLSILIVVLSFLFSLFSIYHYAKINDALEKADAAIVLGAAAWGDKPSPVFKERINHAIDLYHQGTVNKIIFTGGTPKKGYATEAVVGAKWALKNGVDKQDIFVDNISRDTHANLENSLKIAADNHLNSFIIVSDPYHMARVSFMATDMKMDYQLSPTPTSRFNGASNMVKMRFVFKESILIVAYQLFSRTNEILY